jgi:hypothetical protein
MTRLVNQLCDTALEYGYADQAESTDEGLMAEVIRERIEGGMFPGAIQQRRLPARVE